MGVALVPPPTFRTLLTEPSLAGMAIDVMGWLKKISLIN
jgi:hypothetical protein